MSKPAVISIAILATIAAALVLVDQIFPETDEKMRRAGYVPAGSTYSPNERYLLEVYRGDYSDGERYYRFFISGPNDNSKIKEVYVSNFRTSGWKWLGKSNILVTHHCGTGCAFTRVIDIDTTSEAET